MAVQLRRLADDAGRRGLRIGYEALAWSCRIDTYAKAFRIVQAVDRPNFGLILDSFHTLIRPDDWSGLAELPGDKIAFLQVGDARRMAPDYFDQPASSFNASGSRGSGRRSLRPRRDCHRIQWSSVPGNLQRGVTRGSRNGCRGFEACDGAARASGVSAQALNA
jgi:sugar phosphate isomerase/epimerase